MLAAERQARILELVKIQGSVAVETLAQQLNVSPMTIRRDLMKLQSDNQLERCHGGAVAKMEENYIEKSFSHKEEKIQLAMACKPLVSTGDTVYLDAGTTTYEIAKVICTIPDIMVVTNDLEIALMLNKTDVELFLCGGAVQKSTGSMSGYYATEMLQNFHFDIGFFGAANINEEFEVMTPTIEKAFLKRLAVNRCQKSYLVVDQSKFYRQGVAKINQLNDYTANITNYVFTPPQKEKLKQMQIHIQPIK